LTFLDEYKNEKHHRGKMGIKIYGAKLGYDSKSPSSMCSKLENSNLD
jgi:hypothetical protein